MNKKYTYSGNVVFIGFAIFIILLAGAILFCYAYFRTNKILGNDPIYGLLPYGEESLFQLNKVAKYSMLSVDAIKESIKYIDDAKDVYESQKLAIAGITLLSVGLFGLVFSAIFVFSVPRINGRYTYKTPQIAKHLN